MSQSHTPHANSSECLQWHNLLPMMIAMVILICILQGCTRQIVTLCKKTMSSEARRVLSIDGHKEKLVVDITKRTP